MLQIGFFSRRMLEQHERRGRGAASCATWRSGCAPPGMGDAAGRGAAASSSSGCSRRCARACATSPSASSQKQNFDYMEKFRRETLLEKSFYHLTEDEIARRCARW